MHAILILAHKDFEQVYDLSELLIQEFQVFIHFDIKMGLTFEQKKKLDQLGVRYISTVDVRWGSWSIGEATRQLMTLAMLDKTIEYIHLISGQCWPIKPLHKIREQFDNDQNIYMNSTPANDVNKSGENALNWQKFYFNYDIIDRRSLFGKLFHKCSYRVQSLLKINKLSKLGISEQIFQGNNWCDLPRDAVEYCLNYLSSSPNFLKMLETGFCSDEFWIQTILENEVTFSKRINYTFNRFVKWEKQYNSYPAILDASNFEEIRKSSAIFARKVDYAHSKSLIAKINCSLIREEN